jgi:hypothetical protein
LALAAAGFGGFVGGAIAVKVPLPEKWVGAKPAITASGAAAFFVIVYFFNVAVPKDYSVRNATISPATSPVNPGK